MTSPSATDPGALPPLPAVPPAPRRRAALASRGRLAIVVAAVLSLCAVLLYQGLSNATTFFYTADQAVAHRTDQGLRRFRIEGTVVPGSVRTAGTDVRFQIINNSVTVDVVHRGGQPELFKPDIPVVLEGHWAAPPAQDFESDLIMVRHTAQYRQQNPDRVKAYGS